MVANDDVENVTSLGLERVLPNVVVAIDDCILLLISGGDVNSECVYNKLIIIIIILCN